IATVERRAHFPAPAASLRYTAHAGGRAVKVVEPGPASVVRYEQVLAAKLNQENGSVRAYARVHNHNVHRFGGIVGYGLEKIVSRMPEVLRRDLVREVDYRGFRIDAEDHALHGS